MYAKIKKAKEEKFTGNIRKYFTVFGYTKKSGVPTDYMIQIEGSGRWLRVKNYCTSNSGTYFVSTKNNPFLRVQSHEVIGKLK